MEEGPLVLRLQLIYAGERPFWTVRAFGAKIPGTLKVTVPEDWRRRTHPEAPSADLKPESADLDDALKATVLTTASINVVKGAEFSEKLFLHHDYAIPPGRHKVVVQWNMSAYSDRDLSSFRELESNEASVLLDIPSANDKAVMAAVEKLQRDFAREDIPRAEFVNEVLWSKHGAFFPLALKGLELQRGREHLLDNEQDLRPYAFELSQLSDSCRRELLKYLRIYGTAEDAVFLLLFRKHDPAFGRAEVAALLQCRDVQFRLAVLETFPSLCTQAERKEISAELKRLQERSDKLKKRASGTGAPAGAVFMAVAVLLPTVLILWLARRRRRPAASAQAGGHEGAPPQRSGVIEEGN
jgi:hypothetical protein